MTSEEEFLAAYDPSKYPRVAVTVDVVLLTVRAGRLAVLLVQRGRVGTEVAQPRVEGVLERVRGLEERPEHVVVTVNRLGQQRSP